MSSPLRIIFAGTPEFAVPCLQALVDDSAFDVRLVISQPDKPVGRKQEVVATPVKRAALDAGIEVLQPHNINTEYPDIEHDVLVVVAYGQILKQHIIDAPTIAPVNVHASLLPRWRGASPMQSAMLAGDTETGVTIQRMVAALDAGPILAQAPYPLTEDTTISTLHDDLALLGAKLLVETLKKPLTETEQDESLVTVCHKLNRNTGDVDPTTMTAQDICTHVRALVPWPGVRCTVDGEDIKLITVSLEATNESIELPCKNSTLHLCTVQPPGKTVMTGQAWQRGRK